MYQVKQQHCVHYNMLSTNNTMNCGVNLKLVYHDMIISYHGNFITIDKITSYHYSTVNLAITVWCSLIEMKCIMIAYFCMFRCCRDVQVGGGRPRHC